MRSASIAKIERALVGRPDDHPGRLPGKERLLPTRGAKTPAIARLQPREAKLGPGASRVRCPGFLLKAKSRPSPRRRPYAARHPRPGIAAAIAEEARQGESEHSPSGSPRMFLEVSWHVSFPFPIPGPRTDRHAPNKAPAAITNTLCGHVLHAACSVGHVDSQRHHLQSSAATRSTFLPSSSRPGSERGKPLRGKALTGCYQHGMQILMKQCVSSFHQHAMQT
jgi:hypothetical protein